MLDIRMQYLNNCASKMVKECRDGISKSGETAKNFFKYANKNDAHSPSDLHMSVLSKTLFVLTPL